MAALLSGIPFRILSLGDFPRVTLPPEGESSYADNARGKARAVAAATGELALADDSGIEVDALGGGPGVLSARYGGPGLSDPERCQVMLREMTGVPRERRTARFRCLIAVIDPERRHEATLEGVVDGVLLETARGEGGFSSIRPWAGALPSWRRRRRIASVIAPGPSPRRAPGCSRSLERPSGGAVYSQHFTGLRGPKRSMR
jgi:inosine/xanthosine triphosphate pyrophosphatase family protein